VGRLTFRWPRSLNLCLLNLCPGTPAPRSQRHVHRRALFSTEPRRVLGSRLIVSGRLWPARHNGRRPPSRCPKLIRRLCRRAECEIRSSVWTAALSSRFRYGHDDEDYRYAIVTNASHEAAHERRALRRTLTVLILTQCIELIEYQTNLRTDLRIWVRVLQGVSQCDKFRTQFCAQLIYLLR